MNPTDQIAGLSHILDHDIPDMGSGFSIQTSYGEMSIKPGRLADNIRDLLAQDARLALMRAEVERQAQAETARTGAKA
ncbi:hypothetical protein [Hydrogenophaga taeniospiralis]|uniref:hypothetical protein n=1 Tax=Hydrogenophaga taeniospiralis TaxID=65656 RepID=UPI001CF9B09F|nr:hypothetical protein [Hydrogenophaga taeniospiralis]UCU92673.1 hypothetical protein KI616_17795 [Hydrogenophaga taeniospiralis]